MTSQPNTPKTLEIRFSFNGQVSRKRAAADNEIQDSIQEAGKPREKAQELRVNAPVVAASHAEMLRVPKSAHILLD